MINRKGCWVIIGRDIEARILIKDLSDRFVKTPETEFPLGKLVTGRITGINVKDKKATA